MTFATQALLHVIQQLFSSVLCLILHIILVSSKNISFEFLISFKTCLQITILPWKSSTYVVDDFGTKASTAVKLSWWAMDESSLHNETTTLIYVGAQEETFSKLLWNCIYLIPQKQQTVHDPKLCQKLFPKYPVRQIKTFIFQLQLTVLQFGKEFPKLLSKSTNNKDGEKMNHCGSMYLSTFLCIPC